MATSLQGSRHGGLLVLFFIAAKKLRSFSSMLFFKNNIHSIHLTFKKLYVRFFKLPEGKRRLSITLVISREVATARIYYMSFLFFKVKTRFELQIEEYLAWKAKFSEYSANAHKEVLDQFKLFKKFKDITEVSLEEIQAFYEELAKTSRSKFSLIKSMEALRNFMRYFWMHKQHKVHPKHITNQGVKLQIVAENVKIPVMIPKRGPGRPPNVAFIKEVKDLVDRGLGIRAIARAKRMNPGNISRAYHFDLSKLPK